MLGFLFRGLTVDRMGGDKLFDAVTAEARKPHWYSEGQVPDTLDGRFAVLATLMGLVLVRLESDGSAGDVASVALTERFIHVMESEHRELGLGDPTLGKTVRKLVAILAQKTAIWRSACSGDADWIVTTRQSLYKDAVGAPAIRHSADALQRFRKLVGDLTLAQLVAGQMA